MGTDMDKYLEKAEVLIEALPYIQRFNRRIIVVKYGGSAMVDETLKKQVIQDVTLLKLVGFKPIIVHGGGKEISLSLIHILCIRDRYLYHPNISFQPLKDRRPYR